MKAVHQLKPVMIVLQLILEQLMLADKKTVVRWI